MLYFGEGRGVASPHSTMASDAVEFLVLGPLEARAGRERIPLGGPRQRAVLADLVLHAGSVVSRDTLIDDLWAGAPPPTADAVVQNAVSRLRRVLGKEAIETRAAGLRRSGPSRARSTPAASSGSSRTRGRCRRQSAPPRSATRSALWRGSPFADLAFESFLQAEIARLDELRLTALEDRIEAEIELGAPRRRDPRRCPARRAAPRPRAALPSPDARARTGGSAAGGARRLRGDAPRARRAMGSRALPRDPRAASDDPHAGPGARPQRSPLPTAVAHGASPGLAAARRAARRRRPRARGGRGDRPRRPSGSRRRRVPPRRRAVTGVGGRARRGVRRRRRARGRRRPRRHAPASRSARSCAAANVEARLAVGTGRLLVEGSRPVLVGAVVGSTRRALHDAGVDEIQLTASPPASGATRSSSTRTGGSSASARAGRARGGSVAPARRARRTSSRASRPRSTGSSRRGRPATSSSSARRGSGRAASSAAFVEDVPAVVLEAACTPYGQGITFLPLRELADRAAALDADAPPLGELESADAALSAARTLLEHFTASVPGRRRARRPALGGPDVPRSRRVRRPRRGRAPARGLGDPAGAPRAAARLGRGRDGARRARRRRGPPPRRRPSRARGARRRRSRPRSSTRPRAYRSSSSSSPRTRRSPTSRTRGSRRASTRCSRAASTRSSRASAPCSRGRRSSAARSRASRSAR